MNKRLEDYILIDPDLIEETGAQALVSGLIWGSIDSYFLGFDMNSLGT